MPFYELDGDGDAKIKLEQVEAKLFKLLEGFRYERENEREAVKVTFIVTPEALKETDLASVPWGFRWFVNSYGRHTLPALLHDCLVDEKCDCTVIQSGGGTVPPPSRADADDIFLEALRVEEVPTIRRHLMWAAVTFSTRFLYSGWLARVLTIVWILAALAGTVLTLGWIWAAMAGIPLVIAGISLGSVWYLVAGLLGPIPFAFLWGRSWLAGLWFGYGVAFLFPAGLIVHGSFIIYWLVEYVIYGLTEKLPQWLRKRLPPTLTEMFPKWRGLSTSPPPSPKNF